MFSATARATHFETACASSCSASRASIGRLQMAHVEILLKAAIFSDERQLLMEWVLSYIRNMECFPLHVVSDRPENCRASAACCAACRT